MLSDEQVQFDSGSASVLSTEGGGLAAAAATQTGNPNMTMQVTNADGAGTMAATAGQIDQGIDHDAASESTMAGNTISMSTFG